MTAARPEVVVDADVATWLELPHPTASRRERKQWVKGAMHALASDFDLENVEGGVDQRVYLHQLLQAAAGWQPEGAAMMFLRLRSADDHPFPVIVELYDADEVAAIEAELEIEDFVELNLRAGDIPTVGETSLEPVDESSWRRLVYWVADETDAVESRVRYVRRWDDGVVMIFRSSPGDPAQTADALPDMDDLARSARVGGQP